MFRRFAVVVLLALGLVAGSGCSADAGADGVSEDELQSVRCEREFNAPLQDKIGKVKAVLRRSDARFAREVLTALDQRTITALPFCGMTKEHFEHFQHDVDLSAFGRTPEEQLRRLRAGETKGMRSVHAQLFGYMWDETIYIASNMGVDTTMEIVAHEARHVFRKAHERNFDDQRVTCVEELEAARAEIQIKRDTITPAEDRALLRRVQELYELDKLDPDNCGFRQGP